MQPKLFGIVFLFVLMSYSTIDYPAFATSIDKEQLWYDASGATVSSIEADEVFTSLVINLAADNNGKLTIDIPRSFMDSKIGDDDDHFFVLVDSQEVIPEETKTNQKRTLTISFDKNSEIIEIIGTSMDASALQDTTMQTEDESPAPSTESEQVVQEAQGGGCLIATAAYGSELAPQVQQLRELRDSALLQTDTGYSFMESFNTLYYSFSPYIADYERENPVFKETVKLAITPMISSLSILNYVDIDSESEILGYGISLIILNLGMYIGIPTVAIIGIKKMFLVN